MPIATRFQPLAAKKIRGKPKTKNQEPRTKNQEPRTKNQEHRRSRSPKHSATMLAPETLESYRQLTPGQRLRLTIELCRSAWRASGEGLGEGDIGDV